MARNTDKVLRLKKFPLEAEAIATIAQRELTLLSRDELLEYSQLTTMVMSQLRHYTTELLSSLESEGYSLEGEDSGVSSLREL